MEFTFDTQGNNTFFVCNLTTEEELDKTGLGMLENNKLDHILTVIYTQQDEVRSLRMNISSLVPLETLLTRPVNREKILNVFEGICKALLAAEEYLLNENRFLMDKKYIYSNISNGKTSMIYLPVKDNDCETDFTALVKSIMQSVQYASSSDTSYVAPLLNYVNSRSILYPNEMLEFISTLADRGQSKVGEENGQAGIMYEHMPNNYNHGKQQQINEQGFSRQQGYMQLQQHQNYAQPQQNYSQPQAQAQQGFMQNQYSYNQQMQNLQQMQYQNSYSQQMQNQNPYNQQMQSQQRYGQYISDQQTYNPQEYIQGNQTDGASEENDQSVGKKQKSAKEGKKKRSLFSFRKKEHGKVKEEKKTSLGIAIPGRETQASEEQMQQMKESSIRRESGYWQNVSRNSAGQNLQQNNELNRTFRGTNQVFGGNGLQNHQGASFHQPNQDDGYYTVQNVNRFMGNENMGGLGQSYPNNDPYAQLASASVDTISLKKNGGKDVEEDPTMPLFRSRNGGMPSLVVTLRRNRTNEEVRIDKDYFLVGKDPNADFVITGNNTISKSHISITTRDGRFFVTDTNSLNHTYLNNDQLVSSKEYELHSGDLLVLSDEPFEFHVR